MFFSRPIVVALFAITLLSVLTPLVIRALRTVRRRREVVNPIEE